MREASRAPDTGLFILRAVMGVILLTHGWPKLMNGAAGTAEFFGMLGVPLPMITAWLITLLEVFGGLALIVGLAVPLVSLLFIVHMAAGIFLVHMSEGWFVVGPGTGGAEFNVLLIAGFFALILAGSGKPALDALFARKSEPDQTSREKTEESSAG
ncbi:MAG: DoxX family protein [Gemmatimonadota bacterium]